MRIRRHGKVAAPPGRAQISHGRRAAQPVARGELEVARTVLLLAVEIVVARHTHSFGRIDKALADLALDAHVADTERAPSAVQVVAAALLILRALETRQD